MKGTHGTYSQHVSLYTDNPLFTMDTQITNPTHHPMDTSPMNKSSFGSYVNVRKTFNFKRFPNPEVLKVGVLMSSLP